MHVFNLKGIKDKKASLTLLKQKNSFSEKYKKFKEKAELAQVAYKQGKTGKKSPKWGGRAKNVHIHPSFRFSPLLLKDPLNQ